MIIDGVVERGKRLGRTLGFPTLNVRPERADGPWLPNGVYVAAVWIDDTARAWPAILNQGVHPTVPEGKPTVEAHLLGFDGDVYGCRVRVEYLRFLRPERRFDGLEALTAQLARDREDARRWLAECRVSLSAAGSRVREIAWQDVPPD